MAHFGSWVVCMYFNALNERSLVDVVTGSVAKMRNSVVVHGYVPHSVAIVSAKRTRVQGAVLVPRC